MPCNSVITVTVELGANVDSSLLLAGLKRVGTAQRLDNGDLAATVDGHAVKFSSTTRKLEMPGRRGVSYDETINKIKASYSYEVVMSSLRRVGASGLTSQNELGTVVHVRMRGQ